MVVFWTLSGWCRWALYNVLFLSALTQYITNASEKAVVSFLPLNVSVAVVSMVKNEGDILNHWLEYHSLLFGISNIVVLDNYSTDKVTHSLLSAWEQRGLRVFYNQGPYENMGDLVYSALKKTFPTHQLAIPLDADEFLIAYRKGIPIPHRTGIRHTIQMIWNSGGPCFALRQYYGSYPTHKNDTIETVDSFTKSVYGGRMAKKLFWLQQINQISFGAHLGTLKTGEHERIKCHNAIDWLGLLHYHLRSPRVTAERALRDCIALKYLPDTATVDALQVQIPQLEKLVGEHQQDSSMHNIAFHKIEELLRYAIHGENAFVFGPTESLQRVGNISEIISFVRNS